MINWARAIREQWRYQKKVYEYDVSRQFERILYRRELQSEIAEVERRRGNRMFTGDHMSIAELERKAGTTLGYARTSELKGDGVRRLREIAEGKYS